MLLYVISDYQEPYAIVVLLQNDLVVIDLLSPGYPCFENPYPMDIHESPVTCCSYFADCPSDLVSYVEVSSVSVSTILGRFALWPLDEEIPVEPMWKTNFSIFFYSSDLAVMAPKRISLLLYS